MRVVGVGQRRARHAAVKPHVVELAAQRAQTSFYVSKAQLRAAVDLDDAWPCNRCNGRPPYPCSDDELRKVARDAYVRWQANRYYGRIRNGSGMESYQYHAQVLLNLKCL